MTVLKAKRSRRISAVDRYEPKLGNPINQKLGPAIHTWSITAGESCPGKTAACAGCCYAMRGFFCMPSVASRTDKNLAFSRTSEFAEWMRTALWAQRVRVMRIHCAGDFYDEEYIRKWIAVIKRTPRIIYFTYTRSWRLPELMPAIEEMALLPNMRLWFSADVHSGAAPRIEGLQGITWMARDDFEARTAPGWADLVFRNRVDRLMKKANGVQVCPNEIGLPEPHRPLTCTECQLCFRRKVTQQ